MIAVPQNLNDEIQLRRFLQSIVDGIYGAGTVTVGITTINSTAFTSVTVDDYGVLTALTLTDITDRIIALENKVNDIVRAR